MFVSVRRAGLVFYFNPKAFSLPPCDPQASLAPGLPPAKSAPRPATGASSLDPTGDFCP